jgi:hypothetical protein
VPKIKDLGIKVIPEQMRPAECGPFTVCVCTAATPGPCLCTQIVTIRPCALHTTITVCVHCSWQITKIPCLPSIHCWGTCGISEIPYRPDQLTFEQVKTLREQMQQELAALDEYAKTIGPKTADELDAREKQLNAELADLKTRRKNLGK